MITFVEMMTAKDVQTFQFFTSLSIFPLIY